MQPNSTNYGCIGCASSLVDPKDSQDLLHTFSTSLYHKWDVKNGFTYVLTFFSLISDGLGGVLRKTFTSKSPVIFFRTLNRVTSLFAFLHIIFLFMLLLFKEIFRHFFIPSWFDTVMLLQKRLTCQKFQHSARGVINNIVNCFVIKSNGQMIWG